MIQQLKSWLRRRCLIRRINSEIFAAINCRYWGRAHNLCDRLARVQGKPRTNRLAEYQAGKREFARVLGPIFGQTGEWQFDRYTLS